MTTPDDDPLDDVCPLCGLPIKDEEEWARMSNGQIAHANCYYPVED